ncbi:uncharacterized protein VDAG_00325 [Verticillium dahliae VdLs.17]|uniref:Uncharacterized protein n=1 Tax=Verticillium dahliae (strain VdLs.17 / ATCC MYA-4575 / FGSC 10137) TaxID=498257 RepID=G2WRZ2_VERDV|nr:uncharacterized protein VDAG_00325 [Verticillium dahliae VdLs.17]EGY13643.1 hypothetical protein VDAG_00325 [Verticillium dahliae VdLs.17]
MGGGLPSPPLEDNKSQGSRKGSSSSKSIKPNRHTSKRASPHNATAHHDHAAHGMADGRHKRHAVYSMLRNQQQWDLGEPELNDGRQPVIHNIASKLGCIRPNSDIDLPVHSIFPEDEAGLAELARQLEEQQQKEHEMEKSVKVEMESRSSCNLSDRSSSSELDHSDFEADYRKQVFGNNTNVTLSPQSFVGGYNEFDVDSVTSPVDASVMFPGPPAAVASYAPQWATRPTSMDLTTQQFLQQSGALTNMDMLNQGLMESEFGTIKPHMLSCPNPEVMMGMGDPMMYGGYDAESMRL